MMHDDDGQGRGGGHGHGGGHDHGHGGDGGHGGHGHGGGMGDHGSMMKMMEMMKRLPAGVASPSGHYWCAMCKKMFALDEPVCPYMPSMCVNTPVPIETSPPGSTAFYERIGLFYPKFVQSLLATAVRRAAELEPLGVAFAEDFLADLAEWNVQHQASPIETVKAFLIYTAGFDAALRTTDAGLTFFLMDADALWGEDMPAKKRSKAVLLAGARRVAQAVGMTSALDLHFMSVTSGDMGRYFCAQCNMFFEYGQPQAQVTCPFMSQKCKFKPKPIAELVDLPTAHGPDRGERFGVEVLTKVYAVSPKLYRRQLESAMDRGFDPALARDELTARMKTWGFDVSDAGRMSALYRQLGIE
jgi:DNA-directed RNA polymerase subunit RPC12/RpoP